MPLCSLFSPTFREAVYQQDFLEDVVAWYNGGTHVSKTKIAQR